MHAKLYSLLGKDRDAIGYISYCTHLPRDFCKCRKPEIGMLKEISKILNIPLGKNVYFVGDALGRFWFFRDNNCKKRPVER